MLEGCNDDSFLFAEDDELEFCVEVSDLAAQCSSQIGNFDMEQCSSKIGNFDTE